MAELIGAIGRVAGKCPFCSKEATVEVPLWGFMDWKNGEVPVQEAVPTLDASTREFLISGICPTCQDKVFGEA